MGNNNLKNLIIYLFALCLFCHCNNNHPRKGISHSSLHKNKLNQMDLPNELVSHFPNEISSGSNTFQQSQNIYTNTRCKYFILYELNVEKLKIDSLILKVKTDGSLKYNAENDSNLLVIQENRTIKNINSKRNISSNYKITPLFEASSFMIDSNEDMQYIFSSSHTMYGLSEDFDLYIIESKPKFFDKSLTSIDYMPKGWENGYSIGICVNEKKRIVIYWVIIW